MKAIVLLGLALTAVAAAQAPSVPLGSGRPQTPGITRTTLKDDAASSVVRVHFEPGAKEPPHTHPYDVILVFVAAGDAKLDVAGNPGASGVKSGDVFFVPRNTTHALANAGSTSFELITVALKTGS
jgi:quercetin dioxygenase-like cupin family protein